MKHLIKISIAAATALVLGTSAFAGTATGTLAVSALIPASCTVGTSTLAFGLYDPLGANLSADLMVNGTVNVTCSSGAPVTVALGAGAHYDSTNHIRRMSDGSSHTINYEMYSDVVDGTPWGDGTSATNNNVTKAITGTGASQNVTVFGEIPAGQTVPAASTTGISLYTDTVVITVNF